MKDSGILLIAGCLLTLPVFAQDEVVKERSDLELDAGVDIRARYEYKDNWVSSGTRLVNPKYSDYLRFRTRVWGEALYKEKYRLYLRMGNEFRDYSNSTKNDNKNQFPDEIYIDNLYVDILDIGDRVDLRLGRQDIVLGDGRVVKDGTPGDGSRTTYFNAVRATIKMLEKSKLDLIGTYNHYRDDLTIGNPHNDYDLTAMRKGNPYSEMDEIGIIAYYTYNEIENFPMEFYYIWKQESRYYARDTRLPGRNLHTFGTRLIPQFTEKISGEVELAVQGGEIDSQQNMPSRDIFAWMSYGGITYSEKDMFAKPKLTAACIYLSGDTKSYDGVSDGSTDNNWNPLFNRSSWFSEIGAGMDEKYRWSNLIYPHLKAQVEPLKKHKIKAHTGPMFVAEKNADADSNYRGYFTQVKYEFPLLAALCNGRGSLKGAVVGEMLYYGGYYEHDAANVDEDAAYWLRFELKGKF